MNYLTCGIIASGILAATLSIAFGLSCYGCVYTDDTAHAHAYEKTFEVPHNETCLKPDGETSLVKQCESNEQSCVRASMTITAKDTIKIILRRCSKITENSTQGETCVRISEFDSVTRFSEMIEMTKKSAKGGSGDDPKLDGTACICASDTCNKEPGALGDPVTGAADSTVAPDSTVVPEAPTGLGKANHIQKSLPVNAFAIWCLSLYYSSHSA